LIDGFAFAAARGQVRGSCPVGVFDRLKDLLSTTAGELEYAVEGATDEVGRPALRIKVSGNLQLTCQRCLGALGFELAVDSLLVLARNEAEIETQPIDPDSPDRVVGSKEMAVGALLEDEILLAIPFAPRHGQCSATAGKAGGEKPSPFANLRGMLKPGGRAGN
jgi:uncharacterized protein